MASTVSAVEPLAPRRLVAFSAARQTYAIDLCQAREILSPRKATRLPGAPAFVIGLINVRGRIVTVIDLGRYSERGSSWTPDSPIVLIESGGTTLGLAVDAVLDVRDASADGGPADTIVLDGAALLTHVLVSPEGT